MWHKIYFKFLLVCNETYHRALPQGKRQSKYTYGNSYLVWSSHGNSFPKFASSDGELREQRQINQPLALARIYSHDYESSSFRHSLMQKDKHAGAYLMMSHMGGGTNQYGPDGTLGLTNHPLVL